MVLGIIFSVNSSEIYVGTGTMLLSIFNVFTKVSQASLYFVAAFLE